MSADDACAAERTEGYVIRWPGFHGGYKYWSSEHTDPVALTEARVMVLSEAARLFRTLGREAEIVRVRRVVGRDKFVPMTNMEARQVGLQRGDSITTLYGVSGDGSVPVKLVSGESRWEVCDD